MSTPVSPLRLLLVEDNRLIRAAARHALGESAALAVDGPDAVAWLRRAPFDRVVADLNLGAEDGLWVLEQVRRLQPAAERWLTSGAVDGRVNAALGTGLAARFLPKPWRAEDLVELRGPPRG